jgi:starvation-inducible DNA-binding protein
MADQLIDSLKECLADVFVFYVKAQNYHWNVEGPDFYQYHKLFGDIYEDVSDSADGIAELIRTMNQYTPGSLERFKQLSKLSEDDTIPNPLSMVANLRMDNDRVIASLMIAYKQAEDAGELGISNYLQDRIQAHQKHGWFLRATGK